MMAEVKRASEERSTLRMQHSFDAPRRVLWSAWTKPEMLARWFGPAHCPAISAKSDFRVGGDWSVTLEWAADGKQLRPHGVYLEIVPERRLVFTFKWEGDHEDGTPVDTRVTVALSDRPDGRTQLDLTHARLKSHESLVGHHDGWSSSFDRLDTVIGEIAK